MSKQKNPTYSFKSYDQIGFEYILEEEKEDELKQKEKELRKKERALKRWEKDLEQREMKVRELAQEELNKLLLFDVLSGLFDDEDDNYE